MSTAETTLTEAQFHKKMAATLFNETWKLLDKTDRSPEEDARMIHSAHASRLHWEYAGSPENLAIGEWQVSRVHSILRQPNSALFHGKRSLDIAERHKLGAFHRACAHEAIARALAMTDKPAAAEHVAIARKIAEGIEDAEDKKILDEDLATVFGEEN